MELIDRLWERTEIADNGCWLWMGARHPRGYGQICFEGRTEAVHRVSFVLHHGPIPDGLEVDHTCHSFDVSCAGGPDCPHRPCWRPDHLEAVTHGVNTLRGRSPSALHAAKTHCPQGHPYDTVSDGARRCRKCWADASRRYKERKRATT